MKTLVIAEKPSVGRDIAKVLKCSGKGEGYLHGGDYIVSWAIGHLLTLKEPEDYNPNHKKWSKEHLPILPDKMGVKPLPKTKKQLTLLKKIMNGPDVGLIICATDSGREGELIFRFIYNWANCKKPVKRLWISSLTDAAITEGLAKMKDIKAFDNLYASANCRAQADWLVGMNATRAFTISQKELLPMGRVQTPTLALIVERHKEIINFEPKDYWEVSALFSTEAREEYRGLWLDEEGLDRTYNQEKALEIAAKLKGKKGKVESIKKKETSEKPPLLFDLTELQRECNKKLGFSAKKTLELAQSLYEKHKLITYPRTDSRYLPKDMESKLRPIIESITTPDYKPFVDALLNEPKLNITNRIINDKKVSDHHAIIPTGSKKSLASLKPDELKVYDRILRKFLASFYPAHIYDTTTVITKTEGEIFQSKGAKEKNPGWTALYAHEKNENRQEPDLPSLTKGMLVSTIKADVLSKNTKPPVQYTEATLLSAMENAGRLVDNEALKEAMKGSGLGTPSTRAAIIEKLISVGYITRSKKSLNPTEKGIRLIEIVPPEMRQPETTGKWERALTRIAEGAMSEERFMESIRRYTAYLVEQA